MSAQRTMHNFRLRSPFPKLVLAMALLVLLCIAIPVAILWLGPRPLRTHSDTVVYVLKQRNIDYTQLELSQNFEERNSFDNYRATVTVLLPDGTNRHGWIGCENRDQQCFLELRSLGIVGVALPELQPVTAAPAWLSSTRRWLRERGIQ